MGINISPKQLDQTDVLEVMNASIHLYNAEVSWIDIEITEGIAVDSDDKAARIRQFFQDQGISISIDDFGTGYSSLGYLNMLSFDRLKIAKPLIDRIAIDETSVKIVYSIIGLAKSLGIQTIAEGVESKEQHKLYKKPMVKTVKFKAHDENNECHIGDTVRIEETRPMSKDKHWRVVTIVEKAQ